MAFRGALVRATAGQAIPQSVNEPIEYDEAVQDDASFWAAGNPTRLTAPADDIYFIAGAGEQAAAADGLNRAILKLNGATNIGIHTLDGTTTSVKINNVAAIRRLSAGDYVEMLFRHTTTGSHNTVDANWNFPHMVMVQLGFGGVTAFEGALCHHSVNQTYAGRTVLNFDTTDYDDATFHDEVTNNGRLTIAEDGWHIFGSMAALEELGGTYRRNAVRLNGTTYLVEQCADGSAAVGNPQLPLAWAYPFSADDYIETVVDGDAGNDIFTSGSWSPSQWIVRGI